MDLSTVEHLAERTREQVGRVVVGHQAPLELMLVSLLCGGHVLLEGPPGTAKTLLCQCFAGCLSLRFGRVQFTPDLMPGDVLGTNLFDFTSGRFKLTKGPIFTEILLADEINRTPPKTQAALLQAMQERAVTIDGTHHELGDGFMVIATQNPIEHEGTYPLPEAQLDRFLFKVAVGYPPREHERDIVLRHGVGSAHGPEPDLAPIADLGAIAAAREVVGSVHVSDELVDYIVDVVRATREDPNLDVGASPRAAAALCQATRALAALRGRDYAIPDDVKALSLPALRHRAILAPGAEIEGMTTERILDGILAQIPAPR